MSKNTKSILLHVDDDTYAWLEANAKVPINDWIVNAINIKKAISNLTLTVPNSDELAKLAEAEVVHKQITAKDIALKLNKETIYTLDDLAEKFKEFKVNYADAFTHLRPWLDAHGYKVRTEHTFPKFNVA